MKKRFCYEDKKIYLKKIRFYPPFLYYRLDMWLKTMSLNGWHLVHCGAFSFIFEKGLPMTKEYFTYGLATQEGKYNILLRYPMLEKTYGLNRRKSKINSNKTKKYNVVEIDTSRIDIENDSSYKELVGDRNRLYTKHFIRNTSAILIACLILFVLHFLT